MRDGGDSHQQRHIRQNLHVLEKNVAKIDVAITVKPEGKERESECETAGAGASLCLPEVAAVRGSHHDLPSAISQPSGGSRAINAHMQLQNSRISGGGGRKRIRVADRDDSIGGSNFGVKN